MKKSSRLLHVHFTFSAVVLSIDKPPGRTIRIHVPTIVNQIRMFDVGNKPERLVLECLEASSVPLTLEKLTAQLPQLTWNQVFLAVDALSRRGIITLRRRGYEYEATAGRAE